MNLKTILIVDDEPAARYGLRRALEATYRIAEAETVAAARAALPEEKPDLILLDVILPGEDGLSFLRWLREQGSTVPVLMVSALDTAKPAIEALHLGAADYLVKGFELEELRQRVANLLKISTLERENARLRRQVAADGQFGAMTGRSEAMRRVFELAERVAVSDATVLISGESGTGKDLLAQEIHNRSARGEKPFVAVNCAALPETLIESELFGHERGAFTGAAQQKKGRFEQADGGTLFLDEIGDMGAATQAKVLRAIENRTIERLGGAQPISLDVRLISATHRDLAAEVRAGRFREDLFYRLRVVTIELPPLRAHREDIPLLAEAFLRLHGERMGRAARFSKEALAALESYSWPGNVRELKNAVERSLVLCRGEQIGPEDFSPEILSGERLTGKPGAAGGADAGFDETDFREARRKFEIAFLTQQLASRKWNVSRTAAAIGLHRQSLQEKLRELGIRRPGMDGAEAGEDGDEGNDG